MTMVTSPKPELSPQAARRRRRSLALGIVLAAVVVIFYALTIAKLGPGVLDRPL